MASIFETAGDFVVTTLRTADPTFLSGAVATTRPLPPPQVFARGPKIIGPIGTVTATQWWVNAVTMPALPDVVWVLLTDEINIAVELGDSFFTSVFLTVFGDVDNSDEYTAPILGPGSSLVGISTGDATGEAFAVVGVPSTPRPKQLWIPLDPERTKDGWTMLVSSFAGATPPAAGDARIDMTGVTLVGYPSNAWNTGALWAPVSSRGS